MVRERSSWDGHDAGRSPDPVQGKISGTCSAGSAYVWIRDGMRGNTRGDARFDIFALSSPRPSVYLGSHGSFPEGGKLEYAPYGKRRSYPTPPLKCRFRAHSSSDQVCSRCTRTCQRSWLNSLEKKSWPKAVMEGNDLLHNEAVGPALPGWCTITEHRFALCAGV